MCKCLSISRLQSLALEARRYRAIIYNNKSEFREENDLVSGPFTGHVNNLILLSMYNL